MDADYKNAMEYYLGQAKVEPALEMSNAGFIFGAGKAAAGKGLPNLHSRSCYTAGGAGEGLRLGGRD